MLLQMYAAKANSAPCVTLLANARADLEIVDREFGTTAFLIACEHGCASSVSALAAVGANILAVDKDDSSGEALAAGEEPPHDHVLKLLRNCVCDVCAEPCPTSSVLLPNDNMLCMSCFEAQKQGPTEEQDLCRAAKRCAGGQVMLDQLGVPILAPWDSASPRQAPEDTTGSSLTVEATAIPSAASSLADSAPHGRPAHAGGSKNYTIVSAARVRFLRSLCMYVLFRLAGITARPFGAVREGTVAAETPTLIVHLFLRGIKGCYSSTDT